jgi:hypothetical protein
VTMRWPFVLLAIGVLALCISLRVLRHQIAELEARVSALETCE